MARLPDDTPYMHEAAAARRFATVSYSDTADFGGISRGLYVGAAGNVAAVGLDNTVAVFTSVTAGQVLPIQCRRVNSTSTTVTASAIVALF